MFAPTWFSPTRAPFRLRTLVGVALAALTLSARANAGFDVTATLTSAPGGGINIHYLDASNQWAGVTGAGAGYLWQQSPSNNSPNIRNIFTTFCIEIPEEISLNHTYGYNYSQLRNAPNNNGGLGQMGLPVENQIRELWSHVYGNNAAGTDVATNQAFQVAVWNLVYDTDFTVTAHTSTGDKFYISGNTTLATAANADLSWLQSNDPTGSGALTMANLVALTNSNGVQDQITILNSGYSPPGGGQQPVPVPPTAILTLTGLLSCATLRLRRSRPQVA